MRFLPVHVWGKGLPAPLSNTRHDLKKRLGRSRLFGPREAALRGGIQTDGIEKAVAHRAPHHAQPRVLGATGVRHRCRAGW